MKAAFNKIAVIGLGYIGLPTAAVLAARGFTILGVDIDATTVAIINSGKIHINEPDLDALVHRVVNSGHLTAVLKPEAADVFLITVPTPITVGRHPDLTYIDAAINSIAPLLKAGNLIILESTSPVGTTEKISRDLAALRSDLTFPHDAGETAEIAIAYCAERVMPGQILRELVENDRIIGGITPRCTRQAQALYATFVNGECISTNARTAEMTKLTENSFRDVNIAFANELSVLCEEFTLDVWELIKLANRHPRVNILQPGVGVGGHCIAVDPWFIVHSAPQTAQLIRTAREVNDAKPHFVIEKILAAAAKFKQPKIACLGLAYKPNSDDLRESPAIEIISALSAAIASPLFIVEPNISALPAALAKNSSLELTSLQSAFTRADIVVLLVGHDEFSILGEIDLREKVFINMVNPDLLQTTVMPVLKINPQLVPAKEYAG
jgi:UDP-N-acetyl-D-mannosaminuronic acid dehydrogenase